MTLVDLRGTYCASASNADHSRFNILGAVTSFGLALSAVGDGSGSVGVIAPYIAQVRLVRAMMQDYQERRRKDMPDLSEVACSTVHQFQGSERDVVVLDTVESYPAKRPGVLTYKNANGSVDRLVNVAVTRARGDRRRGQRVREALPPPQGLRQRTHGAQRRHRQAAPRPRPRPEHEAVRRG